MTHIVKAQPSQASDGKLPCYTANLFRHPYKLMMANWLIHCGTFCQILDLRSNIRRK